MRPQAREKIGYYPTPESLLDTILSYLAPSPSFARLLDPCAGEGRAAAYVARALGMESWGVEVSPPRAREAEKRLDRVLCTAWPEGARVSNESVSLLWLNPPYDWDGQGKRLELVFLQTATPKLVPGGVLVYIVPERWAQAEAIRAFLHAHYRNVRVLRFPRPEYDRFRQVVVLAVRRAMEEARVPPPAAWPVEPLAAQETPLYPVPPSPRRASGGRQVLFRLAKAPPPLAIEAAAPLARTWLEKHRPRRSDLQMMQVQPVVPLREGHLAMVIAAGLMNAIPVQAQEGPILVRGSLRKEEVVVEEKDGDVRTEERYITVITVLHADGRVEEITDLSDLRAFISRYGADIARAIQERFTPLYDYNPTRAESATAAEVAHGLPPLPGRKERGMTPAQAHAAIAAARSLAHRGAALIQGEMGFGKTIVGPAALYILQQVHGRQAFPALVLCPPHLVEKWVEYIPLVIPGGKAREVRSVADVERFLRDAARGLLGPYPVAVIAETMAKFGPGWHPAVETRRGRPCCPACGAGAEVNDKKMLRCDAPVRRSGAGDEGAPASARTCDEPLYAWGETPSPISFRDFLAWEEGHKLLPPRQDIDLGPRLAQWRRLVSRWSVARYLAHRRRGAFAGLIVDEIHQYKSGRGVDRGVAFQQLVKAVDYVVGLTGTLYGGKASDLFYILYALEPKVRQRFAFTAVNEWVKRFGVLERRYRDVKEGESGHYSGVRRVRVGVKEIPGTSPRVMEYVLGITQFYTLEDLGVPLPDYQETLVVFPMGSEQGRQTARLTEGPLKDLAMADPACLAAWFQWALARPNSAFRDEQVHVVSPRTDETVDMFLPAVIRGDELLPKEAWLVDLVRRERAEGRRVLVFVRQTDTRDIQPRLKAVLERAGLRAEVLKGGGARTRGRRVAQLAGRVDALIVNPRKVETGLDLVEFATVVWYEVEYSLFVVWQATRRVWRPTQALPVRVFYLAYEDSLEHRGYLRVGEKMAAAQLLYGLDVAGALVSTVRDDIVSLARDALEGADLPDWRGALHDSARVLRVDDVPMAAPAPAAPPRSPDRRPAKGETCPPDPTRYVQAALPGLEV